MLSSWIAPPRGVTFRGSITSRIFGVAVVAGCLLAGTGMARAQSPLGFTIDPTLGVPGITVDGQVDVDDVNAFCITDIAEFQAAFGALLEGPYAGGGAGGPLFERFFPGQSDFVFENCDHVAYSLTGIVAFGISLDFNGAAGRAFDQSFVMTFADIATQKPIGDLGTFDPTTGVGSVVVPNLPPGLAAVAAVCIVPTLDLDALEAGVRENGDFLRSLGFTDDICDPNEPAFQEKVEEIFGPGTDIFTFVEAIGPDLVQNIVEFDALGLQFFTVTSFDEQIGNLEAAINALIDSGDIRRGHGRGLLGRLRSIRRNLGKNPPRVASACRQLGNLIRAVQKRVARGHFTPEIGDALIDQIEAVMAAIGCSEGGEPI